MRKHRDIKLVLTERRKNYLMSESNYHSTKFFTENLLSGKIKMTQILMKKPVYLDLSVLALSKIVTYEIWYDYVKPKYGQKARLCDMDTDSFIVYTKTDDIYKDIAEDVGIRFDTSNYELDKKFKKVIGLMKNKLGEK